METVRYRCPECGTITIAGWLNDEPRDDVECECGARADRMPVPTMEEYVGQLEDLVKVQCTDGNWDFDSYHLGLANGLILALAVAKDEDPQFLSAPTRWLEDKRKGMPFVALGEWSSAHGRWFTRTRIYWKGYKWTPFVRVRWRYR